ncbi:acetyl-CoA synthetase [Frigoribacterium sp. PhB160]|uniref:AMP-binding protein n=1 Tax=Frigoribacterium sp. PhB160 TaxID=2485192 RepID=UPI000F4A23B8|nr:AMP-binding protein [Frigoribacterium sp. PhB160]ROS59103.1 acetyl-CoA synthetase [Frigoribacterium sp. PhB160]
MVDHASTPDAPSDGVSAPSSDAPASASAAASGAAAGATAPPWTGPRDPAATDAFRAARDVLIGSGHDHAAARAAFRWPDVGDSFNWAVDWFDVIAAGNDRTALWIVAEDGTETKVSFDEMRRRSDQVAAWFVERGVRHGDHVMLMLGNRVELWEAMLAIMKIGAVILPTSVMLAPHDVEDRVLRGGVRHVLADAADAPKFAGVDPGVGRVVVGGRLEGWASYEDSHRASPARPEVATATDDPCLVYFTSGTTSKPKMVVHTHASYPVGHLSTTYWLGLRPGDVHLTISSPGWGKHAWSCFFAPWIAEATVFVHEQARFSAAALREQLDRAEVTSFCAPPTVWRMLIQSSLGGRPVALREALSAGEPLNPEVISQVQRSWGLDIRDGYGQTETTAIVANPPGSSVVAGSMGLPLPGVEVVLVDPLTGELADEGEICLDLSTRPVNLMTGYLGDPGRTAASQRDGLFHTGDVATRDAAGMITFVGRTDDVFKSSDYKVSPFEVESVLIEHPAVAESAVVPAPDPVRLAVVKAYVVLAAGVEPDDATALAVLRHAREGLPPYERVRRVEFVAELPKTISGKIRRVELRDREEALAAAGERAPGERRDDEFPGLRR